MAETNRIVEELERVVPGRLVKDISAYQKDWWPLLLLDPDIKGSAFAAVKPVNTDELIALVNFASSNDVPLHLRGGGSSVTGASIPSEGVVVDLSAMNQVLDVDERNLTAVIQAGARLKDVEGKLNAKGLTLGQFPQSLDLATLGGYISTMGTGQYSTLVGSIEDVVLKLEVVLPSGEVIWTKKRDSPRSSMGPDLAKLFIGAEGIFGIVAAAELKIKKTPKHVWKAAYGFTTFESALNASKSLMSLDVKPAVCRIHNELESMFQFEQESCVMILVYNFESEAIQDVTKNEVSSMLEPASKVLNPELVDRWMEKRFNFREEIESVRKMGYMPETIEIGVKWTRLFELYVDALRSLEVVKEVSAVGAHVSHLYDQGACIYFTLLLEPKKEAYWKIWEVMSKVAKSHDATLSHHHGVGMLKKVYLKEEVPTKLLEKIKDAIDPKGVVNPGRLV
jgi:alkyldihydroxyacetonephosphate synthase